MLQVTVTETQDLEEAVDKDLAEFDQFFQKLGNDPLSRPERAIIKTYLYWKTHRTK